MQFFTLRSLAVPVTFTSAILTSPFYDVRDATLERRDGDDPPQGPIVCGGGPPCVTAEPTGDTCSFNFQVSGSFVRAWAIGVPGDTLSNYGEGSDTLGGDLLDNLRGQCGVITDWEAESDDGFSTTIFCSEKDVKDAIWLANGKNYEAECKYSDDSWDGLDWSSGVTTGLDVLFSAIGVAASASNGPRPGGK